MSAESDAEQDARWAEESEQMREDNIQIQRGLAHQHLSAAASQLRLVDRAVKRLGEGDLYDVEFEGHEPGYRYARGQIDVALAALAYFVPDPDA